MINKYQSIRGMHDYLPKEIKHWNYVESIIKKILSSYGYHEIRLPIIEYTELFYRTIGNDTDVIEKEMYSFKDRSKHNVTLRPEGTVGCARANINNGLLNDQFQKLWYFGPMFRYERPQKGRYRQFYQMGLEVFGFKGPYIDIELILLISRCWKKLGIDKYLRLEINSIGSTKSREIYKKDLITFLENNQLLLDIDSKRRLYINPLRILDTKNKSIQLLLKKGPLLINYIDKNSMIYFKNICNFMLEMGIEYTINNNLIRGLDYYNDIVFEWKTNKLGTQDTICAGGRYDKLIETLGGPKTPAIGCAIGMERLILLIKEMSSSMMSCYIDIYLVVFNECNKLNIIKIGEILHNSFPMFKIIINYYNGSLKRQFQLANKYHSKVVLLLGPDEQEKNTIIIKDLRNKIQKEILQFNLVKELSYLLSQKNCDYL
ncbi:histidine--tRNA ligase [Buchnera aphidicola (Formosaphis micheliae)]|uniref:histidine--tRNA ligase n=1 Tax=Buchnera aphidicola TaxID=9 RepID=UPI0031CC52B6